MSFGLSQHLGGQLADLICVHIAHHAQQHIAGVIEGPVAQMENFRCDLADGLGSAEDGHADGVLGIHRGHQILKHPGGGFVGSHTDLLIDDAPLLFHAFFGEIGGGNKFQQQFQAIVEMFRAGKIVGGEIVAGKCVDHSAHGGKFRADIPARQIEQLVLQIMSHAGGDGMVDAVKGKFRMHRAEIRDKIGQFFGKARLGQYQHRQTVG